MVNIGHQNIHCISYISSGEKDSHRVSACAFASFLQNISGQRECKRPSSSIRGSGELAAAKKRCAPTR
jgi:hypothetical protein